MLLKAPRRQARLASTANQQEEAEEEADERADRGEEVADASRPGDEFEFDFMSTFANRNSAESQIGRNDLAALAIDSCLPTRGEGVGEQGFGFLLSASGVGSVTGTALIVFVPRTRRLGWLIYLRFDW